MIVNVSYAEKGHGLHEVIRATGHSLWQSGATWFASSPDVQVLIDGYTLEQARTYRCNEVALHARNLRDALMWLTSPFEAGSWPLKLTEARAYLAGGDAAAATILGPEAQRRGLSLQNLCGLVVANASAVAPLESLIAGTDGAHRDAIRQLASFEAVLSYDASTGWPGA